ncbi:hypothetical protein NAC44_02910 [Allorhizobium sp. BGMRC 0089]|uniref:hypothetical protein n=1 Tax=Allorhizobium sonneratiae TaxID=2934936 RepID=UPI00203441C1|nr:hypothetical protein [Allorhizobium sonneratiae]MCM2291277.1 hypothetical protein [Allorhizobium sonneratiae]
MAVLFAVVSLVAVLLLFDEKDEVDELLLSFEAWYSDKAAMEEGTLAAEVVSTLDGGGGGGDVFCEGACGCGGEAGAVYMAAAADEDVVALTDVISGSRQVCIAACLITISGDQTGIVGNALPN